MGEEQNKKISRIAGLLSYGTFWSASRKKVLLEYFCLFALCFFAMVFCVTMLSLEQAKKPDSALKFAMGLISYIIACGITPVWMGVVVAKNEKLRDNVNLWLEDAVEVKAFSKKIGVMRAMGIVKGVRLQVDFVIDNIHYSRESTYYDSLSKKFKAGYYVMWSKYADRQINILYSPKYDEVMILKD